MAKFCDNTNHVSILLMEQSDQGLHSAILNQAVNQKVVFFPKY